MNNVKRIWWLNPVWIYSCWLLFVLYCSTIDSKAFYAMYKEPIYINAYDIFLHSLFFITFAIGFLSYRSKDIKTTPITKYPLDKIISIYNFTYCVTIAAYVIWFFNIYRIFGSGIILNLALNLTGYVYEFKGETNISGVTTFTELGIVVAPLNMYLCCITKRFKKRFVFLIILATLRAAIFAERLAVVEVVLPAFVVYAYYGKFFKNKLIQFAPILGIFVLLLVFGSFEYFRSWEAYRADYNDNITAFVIDRVFGYYSIAVNTECIQINFLGPKYFLHESLGWLWQFPGFSSVPDFFLPGHKIDILTKWGNPEFNNPGGMLFAFKDLGYLGLILQFIFGRFAAYSYKGYCKYDFICSLWYSVTFLSMLELTRYFFWGSNRAFFVIFGILLVQFYLKYSKSNANSLYKRAIPNTANDRY